jgi:tetratricopeptide (TPR) repeat protein
MATVAPKLEVQRPMGLALFRSSGQRRVVLSLLLALLALLLYNPVTQFGFVNFDDPGYVTGNPHVRAGLTWQTVHWAFSSTEQANWHPFTWLSHAFDCQLFHLKAAGHHYDNLLLHALCVVFLFLFLESATGLAGRSAVVAALFAVHPMNVESVAWISERKNILCTVFFLLGLCAYLWYARRPGMKRYLVVAVLFALALMSKPMAITFPCVLLLLDFWPLKRMSGVLHVSPTLGDVGISETTSACPATSVSKLVLEKLPLLLLCVGSAAVTVIVQKSGGALRAEYPFPLRLENALVSYARYIGKAFWPTNLAALYPFPRHGVPGWQVVLATLVVLAISGVVLWQAPKRYLAVGWFWFLGTLVPVIGLVQVGEQAMADRYAYIPFIGLFIALVWAVADWAKARHIPATYLATAALLAAAAMASVAHAQMKYWQSSAALWAHALEVTGPNFVAEDNMGAELINQGNIPAARAHFQRATEINPQDAFSQIDIGVCDKKMGNLPGAIEHYQAALRLSAAPSLRSTAYSNLGSLYRLGDNYPAARDNYLASLRIDPDNPMALLGLGLVTQKTGNLSDAIDDYSRAMAAGPSDVGYVLLARALDAAGRKAESAAALEQARRMALNFDMAQKEAARLLAE